MNECQRGLQGMTRRMMAAVSELALYQVPRGMKSWEAMSQWPGHSGFAYVVQCDDDYRAAPCPRSWGSVGWPAALGVLRPARCVCCRRWRSSTAQTGMRCGQRWQLPGRMWMRGGRPLQTPTRCIHGASGRAAAVRAGVLQRCAPKACKAVFRLRLEAAMGWAVAGPLPPATA